MATTWIDKEGNIRAGQKAMLEYKEANLTPEKRQNRKAAAMGLAVELVNGYWADRFRRSAQITQDKG